MGKIKVLTTRVEMVTEKRTPHALVEPVGKPPERHFLALSGGDVFSLMLIRVVLSMIPGPDDELYLT